MRKWPRGWIQRGFILRFALPCDQGLGLAVCQPGFDCLRVLVIQGTIDSGCFKLGDLGMNVEEHSRGGGVPCPLRQRVNLERSAKHCRTAISPED